MKSSNSYQGIERIVQFYVGLNPDNKIHVQKYKVCSTLIVSAFATSN